MDDRELLAEWAQAMWTVVCAFDRPAAVSRARLAELATELEARAAASPAPLRLTALRDLFKLERHPFWTLVSTLAGDAVRRAIERDHGAPAAARRAFPPGGGGCPRWLIQVMAESAAGPATYEWASFGALINLDLLREVPGALTWLRPGALLGDLGEDVPPPTATLEAPAEEPGIPAALPAPDAGPDALLLGELRPPAVDMAALVLPDGVRRQLEAVLAMHRPRARAVFDAPGMAALVHRARAVSLLFEGPPGTGKTLAAEAVAHALGKPLYVVRWDRLCGMMIGESEANIARMFSESRARDAVLVLDEADSLLLRSSQITQLGDRIHNTMLNLFCTQLEAFTGVVILTTNAASQLDPPLARRLSARIRFDLPAAPERAELWRRLLPAGLAWDAGPDAAALAGRYPLSGSRIRAAIVDAVRRALLAEDPATDPAAPLTARLADLEECCAHHVRQAVRDRGGTEGGAEVEELGELRAPQARLADVVLPPAHRRSLSHLIALNRPADRSLFESEGFRTRFRGGWDNVVLLAGPPGTGKTMTAEAIAQALGKTLLVARLERILSRWVGQSERSLARLFDEAEAHDAVVLIDEADSLLSKRTSAEQAADRLHDNLVNLLLTRLESHPGLIVLTTNRPDLLDPALVSRIGTRLDYPAPDAPTRERIIRGLIPPEVALVGAPLRQLAERYPLDGRQLRSAVLNALRQMVRCDPARRRLGRRRLEAGLAAAARDRDRRGPAVGFRLPHG